MEIKEIARPINNAKNHFIRWLKDRNASDIDEFEGEPDDSWDYYMQVSGFVGETLYVVYFEMWGGKVYIGYSDGENRYDKMSVEAFLELIR